jgi:outer membrane receptor protein involved in Fe transport
MFYVTYARGFKAGGFEGNAAATSQESQSAPALQEQLDDLEGGIKFHDPTGNWEVMADVFHYWYKDKQLLGAVIDPNFGVQYTLVNIPRSHEDGAELQIIARPIRGLTLNGAVTYLHSVIDDTTGTLLINTEGGTCSCVGTEFPNTSPWAATLDAQYEFPIVEGYVGYVGGLLRYQDTSYNSLGVVPLLRVPAYETLDLRAGVTRDKWKFGLWAKNVTNAYYVLTAFRALDFTSRWVGPPVTFGVSLSYRY